MSRVSARTVIAAFFAPPNVTGLNAVFAGEPRNVIEPQYFLAPSGAPKPLSGAVGWPYIEGQRDKRIAFTGGPGPHGGQAKLVIYEVAFSVRFLSYQPKGEVALDDHDAILDNFVTRLRSDRSIGGALWQAGEGDSAMGEDIHVISGPGPKQRKAEGPIVIWSMIRFIAVESI